jgi:hypothetical protein
MFLQEKSHEYTGSKYAWGHFVSRVVTQTGIYILHEGYLLFVKACGAELKLSSSTQNQWIFYISSSLRCKEFSSWRP